MTRPLRRYPVSRASLGGWRTIHSREIAWGAALNALSTITVISTTAVGERAAADAIASQLPSQGGYTSLFCSSQYDLDRLGKAFRRASNDRVIAAATSRAFGPDGILTHGITGFHLPTNRFRVVDTLIENVAQFGFGDARQLVQSLLRRLPRRVEPVWPHRFAMLLVDAESKCEERLVAALGNELGGIPLVGGSTGDLYFNPLGQSPTAARVLLQDRAVRGGAVLSIVASKDPVLALCHHHYVPGNHRLVVTDADPDRRIVREFDGRSALEVYANACGFRRKPKDVAHFSSYPLMVKVGGQYFVRGVQRILDDGALELACAIEPGLIVTVAQPTNILDRLAKSLGTIQAALMTVEVIIGFDCATRTAYMEQHGLSDAVSSLFRNHRVVGFSTLGEQFNTMHMNNSFTCLGVAARN